MNLDIFIHVYWIGYFSFIHIYIYVVDNCTPCSINVEEQVGILSLNMDVGTIWFSWGNCNPSL